MNWKSLFEINIYHGYIFQILLAEILFTFKLKRRSHFWIRAIVGCVVYCFLSIIIPNFIARYTSGLFSMIIFLLSVGLCEACFNSGFRNIIFCCVGAQLTQNLSYNIENLIYLPFAEKISYWGWFLISVVTTFIVYIVCYFLFARRLNSEQPAGERGVGVYLFSLTTALFAYLMQYLMQLYKIDVIWVTRPPLILCCIFGLCVQFEWFALENRRAENIFLERMLEKEKRQYEITKTSMDLINMKAHDLKHQITRIRSMKNAQDDELDKIENVINQYEMSSMTGNRTLDVILAEKTMLCRKHNIQMTIMADGKALEFMSTADIAALFGNALDNAIECEYTIEDKEKRCITLDIHKKGNMLIIRLENYCQNELKADTNFPETSKKDKYNHGFGLKSIHYIAEKYDGVVKIGVKNNIFILSILFQVQ